MNKIFVRIVCFVTQLHLLTATIEYRPARPQDIPELLKLINQEACKERNKIVIFPKKFRKSLLQHTIEAGRLFVATDTSACCHAQKSRIIAYKKLFIVTDTDELHSILTNEIRCLPQPTELKKQENESLLEYNTVEVTMPDHCPRYGNNCEFTDLDSCLFVYDGADFTHPQFRNRGINKNLTDFALDSLAQDILKSKSKRIALLYGLTQENAGSDILTGRTKSILNSFTQLIQRLPGNTRSNVVKVSRYASFMPTFAPESKELKPLPDNLSIPGYGYVMSCEL